MFGGGGGCRVWMVDDEDEGWSFVIVIDEGWVVVWIGSETVIATVCSDSVTCTDSEATVSTTGSGIAFCGECWFSGWFEVGVEMVIWLGDGWWGCSGCCWLGSDSVTVTVCSESITCTDSRTAVSATGSGWFTNSIFWGIGLVAFSGVLVIQVRGWWGVDLKSE